jgi:hypothetical protein
MTQTAHFRESSAQQPSVLVDAPLPSLAHYSGLLGNPRTQIPTAITEFREDELWLWAMLNKQFGSAHPDSKLAILKRQKFPPEGRERRIAASLAALEAAQATILTREEWKGIVEEVEDEDED